MSSASLYNQIYTDNLHRISTGAIEVDPWLADRSADRRLGISLIIPIRGIGEEYGELLSKFRATEPEQYYYPLEDLHATVFDFIQASDGYIRDVDQENEFRLVSYNALAGCTPFSLDLRGPVFSGTAGLLAGYDDDLLITIRNRIRQGMKSKGLKNDERYESISAHVTFCRFRSPLQEPAGLVSLINACRKLHLGFEEVDCMELVEHDWYNSQATKRVIATFALGKGS
jgi:2'-5' RNA ligase